MGVSDANARRLTATPIAEPPAVAYRLSNPSNLGQAIALAVIHYGDVT